MSDKIGLSAAGRALVARLRVPQEAAALPGDPPPDLIDAMLRHGLLERQGETVSPLDLQDTFVSWASQRGMLLDHTRTLAFQNAIKALTRPGDRVIDVGTGSGILAMTAARAGAAEAIGLELTAMADWAETLAAQNGLDNMRIERGDAASYAAPGPADLVMGEFAGMFLLEEWRHYAAFCAVRDQNLRPGGQVLPRAARMYLSAMDSRKLYLVRGYGFWEAPVHGFDFSPVRAAEIARPRRSIVSADPNNVIDTARIAAFDFLTGNERDYVFTSEVTFRYGAAGKFHGVAGHFELDMAPGQVLSTGPFDHETCWHQSYFPLPAFDVPAGGEVALRTRTFLDDDAGTLHLALAVAPPGDRLGPDTPEHVFTLE